MGRKLALEIGQRLEAVLAVLRREEPVAVVARRYGISENSLYRLRDRFLEGGKAAMADGAGQGCTPAGEVSRLKGELDEYKRTVAELTIANRIFKKLEEALP
jgi:transposase